MEEALRGDRNWLRVTGKNVPDVESIRPRLPPMPPSEQASPAHTGTGALASQGQEEDVYMIRVPLLAGARDTITGFLGVTVFVLFYSRVDPCGVVFAPGAQRRDSILLNLPMRSPHSCWQPPGTVHTCLRIIDETCSSLDSFPSPRRRRLTSPTPTLSVSSMH